MQSLAQKDPEFLLADADFPILIDEIQRASEILFSVKKNIDAQRRLRLETNKPTIAAGFRLTGLNQTEIDEALKETLAGRISIFRIHGLSVHELWQHNPQIKLNEILFLRVYAHGCNHIKK